MFRLGPVWRCMSASTAGITTIAPTSENPTDMTVTIPKLLTMLNVERVSAENPKTVVNPETVTAVPIFCTAVWIDRKSVV